MPFEGQPFQNKLISNIKNIIKTLRLLVIFIRLHWLFQQILFIRKMLARKKL